MEEVAGGVSSEDQSKTASGSSSAGNVAEHVYSLPAALDALGDDNSKTPAGERTSSARPLFSLERALHRYVRECGLTDLLGPIDVPPMDSLVQVNLELKSEHVFTNCTSSLNHVSTEMSGSQVESSSSPFLQVEHLLALLESSSLVDEASVPLWRRARLEHECCRFVNALVLTIPLLERSLRALFCALNNCPARMMTAEVYYYCTILVRVRTHVLTPILEGYW